MSSPSARRQGRARRAASASPSPRAATGSYPGIAHPGFAVAAIAAIVAVLGADVFRIGFFADDFHFLDVARRVPWWEALSGQYGIYPWYRPLSRELYFELVTLATPLERVIAHGLSLACVGVAAWQIRRIGAHLATERVGAIAALLFVTYALTRFLTAWASGFQDLLAVLFVLLAVRAQLEGKPGRAAVWAFLGVFAKETAFIAFPLLALDEWWLRRGREGSVRRLLSFAGVFALAVAVHLAIRAFWTAGGTSAVITFSMTALLGSLVGAIRGFVGGIPRIEPLAIALAAAAALSAALLLASSSPRSTAQVRRSRTLAFLAVAAALGLAPLVAGHVARLAATHEYYAFPAAPWLALLLALGVARLPRAAGTWATCGLVAWNTLALAYREPDLRTAEAWKFKAWNWAETLRLSAISERLSAGVRRHLAVRPESLVVLYVDVPIGSYFQTEDGPATREALLDPTVRAYWINTPPYGLEPEAFTILAFDSGTQELVTHRLSVTDRSGMAATAVANGFAPSGWAFASYGDSAENAQFQLVYYRAVAALMAEGVSGALRELDRLGLADTTGVMPDVWAERVFPEPGDYQSAIRTVLRHPLDAAAHVTLADVFAAHGVPVSEGVELRIATTLEPGRIRERLRLARTLIALGQYAAARRDLERIVAEGPDGAAATEARALLSESETKARAASDTSRARATER